MSLLDVLADSPDPVALKHLAAATGLHPSTAHRILASMTGSRLVERHDRADEAVATTQVDHLVAVGDLGQVREQQGGPGIEPRR